MSMEMKNGKSKSVYKSYAELIVAGLMTFAELAKRLRKGVAAVLKAMGREDLATDSNATPKGEE